jgi:phytoene dehydrogenase-like protein
VSEHGDITTREDCERLVRAFYGQAMGDAILGFLFVDVARLDLEDELRMPGGHIFHRDLQWPFAEREDEVGTWGAQTADPRVLLCGAGARRGGGVSAIAGHNAAMAILSPAGRAA